MFKKKKLYKIVYRLYDTHNTVIVAKDKFQAFRKLKREVAKTGIRPTIISLEEYKFA